MEKLYMDLMTSQARSSNSYPGYSTNLFTPKLYFMRLFTLRITLITCLAMMGMQSFAQPNTISLGGTYTQDFNSMLISATATLPTGWRADGDKSKLTVGPWSGAGTTTERIGGANMNSGSPDGIYNFGAGTTSNGNGDRSGKALLGV